MKIFTCDYGKGVQGKVFWFRVFGYGLHFKKHTDYLVFSERYGYSKYYVLFGVRIKILTPR